MFKNASHDPLAIPTPVKRVSVGPTRRQADNASFVMSPEALPAAEKQRKARSHEAALPPRVARVLTAQAREFLAQDHGGCEDRSELLYRARRHAATLTSTWSREASQRAAEAFCAQVAELIPNRSKTAAVARSATHVADFDDQLLF